MSRPSVNVIKLITRIKQTKKSLNIHQENGCCRENQCICLLQWRSIKRMQCADIDSFALYHISEDLSVKTRSEVCVVLLANLYLISQNKIHPPTLWRTMLSLSSHTGQPTQLTQYADLCPYSVVYKLLLCSTECFTSVSILIMKHGAVKLPNILIGRWDWGKKETLHSP